MTKDEEAQIIERIQAGESEAFEALVLEYQKYVYNLAFRMVGNEEDALDMSQEAFLKAFDHIGDFHGFSKFSVWLYRLTSNVCIDFLRKKKNRPESSLVYINDDGEEQDVEIPDIRYAPETKLEKKQLQESLNKALEKLSPNFREIILLREINGLSYEEIGEALSLESGTVKSRLFRARKMLCGLLFEDGNILSGLPSNEAKGV
jgi:RNA polymerase sigma factor (sigma-70 family)